MNLLTRFNDTLPSALWALKSNMKDGFTSRRWPQRPQSLMFEITSVCDARCVHCPRQDMDRPIRPQWNSASSNFQRLIDQAAELRIPELCPNGYGEVLTLPNLRAYLEYISSKQHKFRLNII